MAGSLRRQRWTLVLCAVGGLLSGCGRENEHRPNPKLEGAPALGSLGGAPSDAGYLPGARAPAPIDLRSTGVNPMGPAPTR